MRVYKFRGKSIYTNEWVYGFYLEQDTYNFGSKNTKKDLLGKSTSLIVEDTKRASATPVQKETVGQFTGLYDKNRKEIYEGDILQIDIERAWVMWNEKYGYFELVPIGDYYFDSPVIGQAIEYTDATVIGNIYDNKELLNETNR